MKRDYWSLVFLCGCARCHRRKKIYFNEKVPETVIDIDYTCRLTGMNYLNSKQYVKRNQKYER